jgi:hypothetical protein
VNISVYIERLILDGMHLASGQGAKVKAAVEAELSRLLAEGGVESSLRSGGAFHKMPARPIRVSEEIHPNRLGQQIARSVYGSIGQSTSQKGPDSKALKG